MATFGNRFAPGLASHRFASLQIFVCSVSFSMQGRNSAAGCGLLSSGSGIHPAMMAANALSLCLWPFPCIAFRMQLRFFLLRPKAFFPRFGNSLELVPVLARSAKMSLSLTTRVISVMGLLTDDKHRFDGHCGCRAVFIPPQTRISQNSGREMAKYWQISVSEVVSQYNFDDLIAMNHHGHLTGEMDFKVSKGAPAPSLRSRGSQCELLMNVPKCKVNRIERNIGICNRYTISNTAAQRVVKKHFTNEVLAL
jgi:hypothetical protein